MTPWDEVFTLRPDEDARSAIETLREGLRVVSNGNILGLVSLVELEGKVGEVLRPIDASMLISGDSPLEEGVHRILESDFMFVVGSKGIAGIVTPADLGKRPMYHYLYSLITELELAIAELISRRVEDPLKYFTEEKKDKILGRIEAVRRENLHLNMIEYLWLPEFAELLKKTELWAELGYTSKKELERVFDPLINVRNRIAHPVRPLIESRRELDLLSRFFVGYEDLMSRISRLLERR